MRRRPQSKSGMSIVGPMAGTLSLVVRRLRVMLNAYSSEPVIAKRG